MVGPDPFVLHAAGYRRELVLGMVVLVCLSEPGAGAKQERRMVQ
jgi:hypothetical protein